MSMRWPDAKDKYWYCGHAARFPTCPRGSWWTPFCLMKQDAEPHFTCGEHNQPYIGWVQADNARQARKVVAAFLEVVGGPTEVRK